MKHLLRQLALVAAVVAAIWAVTAWPRIDEVETGRAPEYPELQPHDYAASVDAVAKAARSVVGRLPGWAIVGEGKGPAGAEIQAVRTSWLLLEDDVTIRIRREKGRTRVGVRSKSRLGPWDFGRNARNVRELLDALDHEVF